MANINTNFDFNKFESIIFKKNFLYLILYQYYHLSLFYFYNLDYQNYFN